MQTTTSIADCHGCKALLEPVDANMYYNIKRFLVRLKTFSEPSEVSLKLVAEFKKGGFFFLQEQFLRFFYATTTIDPHFGRVDFESAEMSGPIVSPRFSSLALQTP